eukprot:Skav219170  [mRNA]  locus=scaffold648:332883:337686:- [translate_table: standard]
MQTKHLLRSVPSGRLFVYQGKLDEGSTVVLFGNVKVKAAEPYMTMQEDPTTFMHNRPTMTTEGLSQVVELCSGIGCLGVGLEQCGFNIKLRCGHSQPIMDLAPKMSDVPTLCADITNPDTIHRVIQSAPEAGVLAAGIACQPYSRLGDKGHQSDPRSLTLPAVLKLGFRGRYAVILLECVTEAYSCQWVQSTLTKFCSQTGYRMHQGITHLGEVWPARRSRWWCTLTHPSIGPIGWEDMPKVDPPPMVANLLDSFKACEDWEYKQLQLDLYELRYFDDFGFATNTIPTAGQMATNELALLNGMLPGQHWGDHLRLALCALGQLASPLQSAWIGARIKQVLTNKGLLHHSTESPRQVLSKYMQLLLSARDKCFGQQIGQPTQRFATMVNQGEFTMPKVDTQPASTPAVEPARKRPRPTCAPTKQPQVQPALPTKAVEHSSGGIGGFETRSMTHGHAPDVSSSQEADQVLRNHFARHDGPRHHSQTPLPEPANGPPGCPEVPPAQPAATHVPVHSMPDHSRTHSSPCTNMHDTSRDGEVVESSGVDASRASHAISGESPMIDPHASEQAHPEHHHSIMHPSPSSHDQDSRHPPVKRMPSMEDLTHPATVTISTVATEDTAQASNEPDRTADTSHVSHAVPHEASSVPAYDQEAIASPQMIDIYVTHVDACTTHVVQVQVGTTIAQLTRAEVTTSKQEVCQPVKVVNAMGLHMPATMTLTEPCSVLFHQSTFPDYRCPAMHTNHERPAIWFPCARLTALEQQGPWVAIDEMSLYLKSLELDAIATAVEPMNFDDEDHLEQDGSQWIVPYLDNMESQHNYATAILVDQHWVPLMWNREGDCMSVVTTLQGRKLIAAFQEWALRNEVAVIHEYRSLSHAFPGDCGFQCIGWLVANLQDQVPEPLQVDKTIEWRKMFRKALINQNKDLDMVTCLPMGGVLDTKQQLIQLLVQHGVWEDRADERAAVILNRLGLPTVMKVLQSNKKWVDLKMFANQAKPALRLIQQDELDAQIESRATQRKGFGKKPKPAKPESKAAVTPKAQDLQVPAGVFVQQGGQALEPISPDQLGPRAAGVLLLDQDQSEATLRLQRPVSQHGLAAIVLANGSNQDQHQGAPIKFPVSRHEPEQKIEVEVQEADVIRCLVYKDQAGDVWDEMQTQPVKAVLKSFPLPLQTKPMENAILDVWDRQWLTRKFERSKQAHADIFVFSLRLLSKHTDQVLRASGASGMYYEPRTQCGRYPSDLYHVTWLPQLTYQDAKYAQQTSPQETTLVRHGDRFGLRSDTMNAQEVHEKHRPGVPMLLGNTKTQYLVGPLPFSTTKDGIIKLLKSWKWEAVPLQPRGRTPDQAGIAWAIQATEDPSHWVYSCKHGDVLVTRQQPERKPNPAAMPAIVASRKTLAHFQQPDPWLQHDPWSRPVDAAARKPVPSSSQPVTQNQLATLEQSVERRVLQAIQARSEADVSMESTQIESKVQLLEQQVAAVQQSQQAIEGRVTHMQTQLDQQTNVFANIMETKMQEQMDRIDQLLRKRSIHE